MSITATPAKIIDDNEMKLISPATASESTPSPTTSESEWNGKSVTLVTGSQDDSYIEMVTILSETELKRFQSAELDYLKGLAGRCSTTAPMLTVEDM